MVEVGGDMWPILPHADRKVGVRGRFVVAMPCIPVRVVWWWGRGHGPCSVLAARAWAMLSAGSEGRGRQMTSMTSGFVLRRTCGKTDVRTCRMTRRVPPRRRDLAANTEHGPYAPPTNTDHHHTTRTGMTHGDYRPAPHPPPSDLGGYGPLLTNHHPPPPPPGLAPNP